jgi:outer membrane protein assembly factor BamE
LTHLAINMTDRTIVGTLGSIHDRRLSYGVGRALHCLVLASILGVGVGCAKAPEITSIKDIKIPGVFRQDVQQGNVLDEKNISRLELGMTKRKVSYLVGTPAIRDTFNQDRWDYVYTFQPGDGDREQRHLSLFFSGENLTRIDGDLPPKKETEEAPVVQERVVDVPPGYNKRSFISSLNPWSDASHRVRKKQGQAADAEDNATANSAAPKTDAAEPTKRPAQSAEVTPAPPAAPATQGPDNTVGEKDADANAAPAQKSLFDRLTDRFSISDTAPVQDIAEEDDGG